MSSSFFYCEDAIREKFPAFVAGLERFAEDRQLQFYIVNRPLSDKKYSYRYGDAVVVLAPKHKLMFCNLGDNAEAYEDFCDEFLEDLGVVSDKYDYKTIIGRPKKWISEVVNTDASFNDLAAIQETLAQNALNHPLQQKTSELLISLLTGSINDINRVRAEVPESLLGKIKQKIILFDGDQTRFVYQESNKKVIRIQGLSGTGKTELLLHKLKEIYTDSDSGKILFTCHNKILASSIKNRIPTFFNFMRVEKQIEWNSRLWCVHAWGSRNDITSGAYRYICDRYNIPFFPYSPVNQFDKVCKMAVDLLRGTDFSKVGYAFDYVLIDESQDFPKEFIQLCELVTSKLVIVAGDIFQSIFDENIVTAIEPDFLLSKCYRTDPRTLMFAHGLGMGLFENEKLRWLDDREWEACGYKVSKVIDRGRNRYNLTRVPLRRFEDLANEQVPSMQMLQMQEGQNTVGIVISLIERIIHSNRDVTPDDIGIVFTNDSGFQIADALEYKIKEKFNWNVNKAYESKHRVDGTIFISNKNNVKGLEFPFVICICGKITSSRRGRNALYMLLSRSFLQSYLVLSQNEEAELVQSLQEGLNEINQNNRITLIEPSTQEKEAIRTKIAIPEAERRGDQIAIDLFDELEVPPKMKGPLLELIKGLPKKSQTEKKIREIIATNIQTLENDE